MDKLNFNPLSNKYLEAKRKLSEDTQEIFELLVNDYAFYALKTMGVTGLLTRF